MDIRLFIEAEEKIKSNTDISKYNHNKFILSDAISCIVTETTDGILDLDLVYPLQDAKNLSQYLVRGNIIKCLISQTDARGEQLFTIRKRTPSTKENRVTIYAQAKARRDLDLNMVVGMKTTGIETRKQALQILLNACVEPHNYIIGRLDTNTNTSVNLGLNETTGQIINYLDINGVSPRNGILSDSETSICKAYGGEIIYNNFELNIVDERGTDNTILIKSGKNLEDLQQEIDDTDLENLATAILPCSADKIYLPNSEIIYSPNVQALGNIFKKIVFDDVTAVNNTQEALNIVYSQLRERAQNKFSDGMDKLKINNTINFIQLANTEEYKNYATLEKCEIGNNVIVRYYKRGDENVFIEATGRVVKIKFNVLRNKIEEVEVGDRKKKSIVDTISSTANNVTTVNDKTNSNTDKIKKVKSYATDITNNLQVVMEKKDTEIELSVTNLDTNTQAKFLIQDGLISQRVTTDEFSTYKSQTATEISQKVAKGADFSSEMKQNVSAFQFLFNGASSGKTEINAEGITVYSGGFKIKDDSGNTVFSIDSNGRIHIGAAYIDDLDIGDTSTSGMFYNTLVNMDEIVCNEIKPSRLTLDSSDFYIGNGYSLTEWIEKVLADNSLI